MEKLFQYIGKVHKFWFLFPYKKESHRKLFLKLREKYVNSGFLFPENGNSTEKHSSNTGKVCAF